jgi:hypothetical protein
VSTTQDIWDRRALLAGHTYGLAATDMWGHTQYVGELVSELKQSTDEVTVSTPALPGVEVSSRTYTFTTERLVFGGTVRLAHGQNNPASLPAVLSTGVPLEIVLGADSPFLPLAWSAWYGGNQSQVHFLDDVVDPNIGNPVLILRLDTAFVTLAQGPTVP